MTSFFVPVRFPACTLTVALLLAMVPPAPGQSIVVTGDVSPNLPTQPIWIVGELRVGEEDNGTLEIGDDAVVLASDQGVIGYGEGSTGLVKVSGGSWWGALAVGREGNGTLELSGGEVLASTASIGDAGGSTGLVKVSGGRWESNSLLALGVSGNGTLEVSDSGDVWAPSLEMAKESTSVADLNLLGGRLTTDQISKGAGSGTVTFNGGTLRFEDDQPNLFSGFGAGDVRLTGSGGTIDTPLEVSVATAQGFTGAGSLTKQGNGTLTLSGASVHTGETTVRNGALQVTGSISGSSFVVVGDQSGDDGTLEISGSVSNAFGSIGNDADSTGLAKVSGNGMWANTTVLQVGASGNGTLEISGNASVSSPTGAIGSFSGSQGLVKVSGGTWTNAGALTVADAGHGTLEISGTGTVANTNATIGSDSGSTGVARVNGGSWTSSSFLMVGGSGSGTLEISDTGTVSNAFGIIGSLGTGVAKVSGGSWTNSGTLTVADAGHGTLEISGTGAVSNTSSMIGVGGTSTGLAKVSGGTWTNSGTLTVGNSGGGILEVSGDGLVSASSVRVANNASGTGSVNLLGGTLITGQLSKGAGSGGVTFNGGTLRLSANRADLFNGFGDGQVTLIDEGGAIDTQAFAVETAVELSGDGSFTKRGSGTLTLTGDSSYTGLTIVEAGTLFVDGLITSAVTVKDGATFGGDGVVGDITLESGSTLVTVDCLDGDSLVWNAGATLVFSLGEGYSDILELGGDLTKGGSGAYAFTFTDAGWQAGQTYTLLFFEGDTNFAESHFTFTNGGGFRGTFALSENTVEFTLVAVPEPSTCAVAIGMLLMVVLRLRRKRTIFAAR